jgi:hypothetical protein
LSSRKMSGLSVAALNVRCDGRGKCYAPETRIIEADVSLIRLRHDVPNYLYWTGENGSPIIDPRMVVG